MFKDSRAGVPNQDPQRADHLGLQYCKYLLLSRHSFILHHGCAGVWRNGSSTLGAHQSRLHTRSCFAHRIIAVRMHLLPPLWEEPPFLPAPCSYNGVRGVLSGNGAGPLLLLRPRTSRGLERPPRPFVRRSKEFSAVHNVRGAHVAVLHFHSPPHPAHHVVDVDGHAHTRPRLLQYHQHQRQWRREGGVLVSRPFSREALDWLCLRLWCFPLAPQFVLVLENYPRDDKGALTRTTQKEL